MAKCKKISIILISLFIHGQSFGQLFKRIALDSFGITPYELYPTKEGVTWMTSSIGMWRIKGRELTSPSVSDGRMYDDKGNLQKQVIKFREYQAEDSIRSMAQGPDSIFYFVTHYNFFLWRPNGEVGGWGWPPFNFPTTSPVLKIWIDYQGNIYAGTRQDGFYIIEKAAINYRSWKGIDFGPDKDSNYFVTKGGKKVTQIALQPNTGVYSFVADEENKNNVWVGTSKGLFIYDAMKATVTTVLADNNITVTEIFTGEKDKVWFSTLEKGMGVYNIKLKTTQFYPYKRNNKGISVNSPVKSFCFKSPGRFYVAAMDSLPAIFNTESRTYFFINDSRLAETPNKTTEIKVDRQGNLLLLKGGSFFLADVSKSDLLRTAIVKDSSLMAPFIRSVGLLDGTELTNLDYHPELLKKISLKYNKNSVVVFYDINDFSDENDIKFAWKIEGYSEGWREMPRLNMDSTRVVYLQDLKPGKYLLQIKVRVGKENWRSQLAEIEIIVESPFWQTWWFWLSIIAVITAIVFTIVKLRIRYVRKSERQKAKHELELLELESKALRAQMNPHFVFNCLNSIKSLIQQKEEEKSVTYLTTFSKLIRTLFNNADKKDITLYDEVETCKLYLQLEAMRFDTKFSYAVKVDENLDLKSVLVPALIIQPFIENAIWHGIVPKGEGGHVQLSIRQKDNSVEISIDDNGIGRDASKQNKPANSLLHQSKGVNLTQSRLELDNLLRQRQAQLIMIDKKDDNGFATGTKVIITINEEGI